MARHRGICIISVLILLTIVFATSLVYNLGYADRGSPIKKFTALRIAQDQRGRKELVSALNQRWMTWGSIDKPGTYRACVPYPTPESVFDRDLSGGLVEDDSQMTILRCLHRCTSAEATYAALTKGRQCYCTNAHRSTTLLSYVDSALCDVPCAGNATYDCGGKAHFSLYRTSVPDPRCSLVELGKEGEFPLVALASYPRSGNTWTRQLIEEASGIYTGSIYWKTEKKLETAQAVFKGGIVDYSTKRTICVKSHMSQSSHIAPFEAAVLLIRNPYRTLVAEVFRRSMYDMNEAAHFFKSDEWNHYVEKQAAIWHDTNVQWIRKSKRLLVIHYEYLERDTERQLARIIKFLDETRLDLDRVACAVQDIPSSFSTGVSLGNFGVKTRAYLTQDPFTPSMHKALDAFIQDVNSSLIIKGQDVLPSDYGNVKVY